MIAQTANRFETVRADELVPGDVFNTHCGVGHWAWARIVTCRLVENDQPGAQDRIEIVYDADVICPVKVFLADSPVQIRF